MTKTLEELIRLNHDLRVTLLSKWQSKVSYIKDGKFWPLLYLVIQVANLHESIELLASKGFGREAGMLLRSMFEATVNVKWIAMDPDARLERYAAYRYFAAEQYRDLGKRLPSREGQSLKEYEQYEKESEQVRRDAKKAKDQYGFQKRQYWSGKSVREMAKEVSWLPRYEAIYKIYSDVLHSNIGSSQDFVSASDSGTIYIQREARFPHEKPVLSEAYFYLTITLALADAYIGLGIEKEIDEAIEKIQEILPSTLSKPDNFSDTQDK